MERWKGKLNMVAALCCAGVVWAGRESTTYTYDPAGRLVAAYTTSGATNMAVVFHYDLAGNRFRETRYAPAEANGDLDADALADTMELGYFQHLDQNGAGDPDSDGLANSNEFSSAGHPLLPDTDGDDQSDLDEFIAGTRLDDRAEFFYVTNTVPVSGNQARILCATKAGRSYLLQKCRQPTAPWTDEGTEYAAPSDGAYFWDVLRETNANFRIRVRLTYP